MTDRHDAPTSPKHEIDPLELTREAVEEAYQLFRDGHATIARRQFRRRLEEVLRVMCPMCGKTSDHETADHRWVAPRQKTLGGL